MLNNTEYNSRKKRWEIPYYLKSISELNCSKNFVCFNPHCRMDLIEEILAVMMRYTFQVFKEN